MAVYTLPNLPYDSPAGPRVSAEDMAVALVDEAESDTHRGARWTVASEG